MSRRALGLAHALCGLAFASCGHRPEESPDLLLVTLDTLRSDSLSCYGYPRPVTPVLDELAAEGALFEAHFTSMATTAPAHASLFTGLHPRSHGLSKNGQHLAAELAYLPEILKGQGYRTVAAIGSLVLGSEQGFARGFESFDEDFSDAVLRPPGKSGAYERYGESVVDRAIELARADDGRPTFLWVHLYDAHDPYQPPRASPFAPERHLPFFRGRAHPSPLLERALVARMLAGYEAEVAYVDAEVARLLDAWDERDGGPSSLVVVTADHGEGLGEHAYQGHGFLLYEEQIRVPLLVRMRGAIEPGARVDAVTSVVDVAATLLELLGLPSASGLAGTSFASLLPSEDAGELDARELGARELGVREAFAERRSYGEGDLERSPALNELIAHFADEPLGSVGEKTVLVADGFKFIWNEGGLHELYDLLADPDEATNLAATDPERAESMRARVEAWRASQFLRVQSDPDDAQREMLDALGY